MSHFPVFQQAVARQFAAMSETGLYRVTLEQDEEPVASDEHKRPSLLWTTYLQSFPEGANPLYRVRTEHDCSCCRHFLRDMGSVVTLRDGALVTLWDFEIESPYQPVADALATLVREQADIHGIANLFLATSSTVGVAQTRQLLPGQQVQTFNHFCVDVPVGYRIALFKLRERLAEARSTHEVFLRALTELTQEATMTVLDLIDENMLYRGSEHQHTLQAFRSHKHAFAQLSTPQARDWYCWAHGRNTPPVVTHIRNTAIGTLLVDLSGGRDLDEAVRAYERMIAPTNYQRPTALVSKQQIAQAQAQVEALGLLPALERRYAVIEDITINNVLWADRSAKRAMGVFESLAATVPVSKKQTDKAQDIPLEHFLTEVLPGATGLEVLVENRHAGNLVSLIAPSDPSAPGLFQWDNNFSWTYAGDLADSIKERVKQAGGNVEGDFRASLAWYNHDDLDLHLREPGGFEVYFAQGRKPSSSPHGGQLDVDMNAGRGYTRTPVENIAYPDRRGMGEGVYQLFVHQYARRESMDTGFQAELAFGGQEYAFTYDKPLRQDEEVLIARFTYTHTQGLQMLESLPTATLSRTLWGIPTQTMRKVNVVMFSPNYWDEQARGNKHTFFMLDGCLREGTARGFFNEYLKADLRPHRQVLERVGSRMHTEEAARQLSGLGFSSTLPNTLLCRVNGARNFNIIFA